MCWGCHRERRPSSVAAEPWKWKVLSVAVSVFVAFCRSSPSALETRARALQRLLRCPDFPGFAAVLCSCGGLGTVSRRARIPGFPAGFAARAARMPDPDFYTKCLQESFDELYAATVG